MLKVTYGQFLGAPPSTFAGLRPQYHIFGTADRSWAKNQQHMGEYGGIWGNTEYIDVHRFLDVYCVFFMYLLSFGVLAAYLTFFCGSG
jgi:hypothetical protein